MRKLSYLELNNKVNIKNKEGFYNLEADKLALDAYLDDLNLEFMHFNCYEDKLNYLITHGYYIDFTVMYPLDFISELAALVYSYNFKFQSFMAAQKFYETYALKNWQRTHLLETYEDRIIATALYIAQTDQSFAKDLAIRLITQQFQPATPTFLNSGKAKSGELVSCFLLEMDDSLNSINYNLSTSMQLSKIGGGVAINLSKLRARGEAIKGNHGVGRGVIPVMKLLEDAFNYVDQLGQRPGAGAVYLNIFHADVLEFLNTKKINSDEKARIQTLSLGLVIPNKFMELAKNNEEMCLFYPHTVFKEYNIALDDMDLDSMYEILRDNKNVSRKVISPRDLLLKIATTQYESGYPYLVYADTANRNNPLKNIGKIKISNLCTEIFQIQTTSKINDYGVDDEIGYDISCNLGSLNITNLMEANDLQETIMISMRSLTQVSEISKIPNAPGINKASQDFHSVGLGVMNLHGFLAKNNIAYESDEALDFCNTFFPILNYYSLLASNKIALEKGSSFKGFEQSTYASGEYFAIYRDTEFIPRTAKVRAIFQDMYIPTKQDWLNLEAAIKSGGLYNSYRLAIAPTQSISYIQNSTASIQPIVDIVETRMYKNAVTYYPMPYLTTSNMFFYKSAYNMNQKKIIDLVATIQPHIDQGIATVLYVTNQNTTKDLASLYYYAWAKGLKSLYYIRTKNLTIAECETCSV